MCTKYFCIKEILCMKNLSLKRKLSFQPDMQKVGNLGTRHAKSREPGNLDIFQKGNMFRL